MKPHEETWIVAETAGVDGRYPTICTLDPDDPREALGVFDAPKDYDGKRAERVKLAAQAPAMARLLLNADGDPEYMDRVRDVPRAGGVIP